MGKFLLRSVFCVLMIALASSSVHCGPFIEVPAGHWTYKELRNLNEKIVNLSLDDILNREPITRYEMAVIIVELLEKVPYCGSEKTSQECINQLRIYLKNPTTSEQELDDLMKGIKKLVSEFKNEFSGKVKICPPEALTLSLIRVKNKIYQSFSNSAFLKMNLLSKTSATQINRGHAMLLSKQAQNHLTNTKGFLLYLIHPTNICW